MMSKTAYSVLSMKTQRIRDAKILKNENSSVIVEPVAKNYNPDKSFKVVSDKLSITSIPYSLYMYRKELHRQKIHIIRLSKAKIELTDGLVTKTVHKINVGLINGVNCANFNYDMNVLTRAIIYKKKLQERINRIEAFYLKMKEQQKNKGAKEEDQKEAVAATINLQKTQQDNEFIL